MPKFKDLTGSTFGRFLVLKLSGRNKHGHFMWRCLCSCGNEAKVSTADLNCGKSASCGCVNRERIIKNNTSHGLSKTLAYRSWKAMKNRCYNTSLATYKNYGGRGILVCERWVNSFENFIADMGDRPSRNHSIERINNNGIYSPENCRWATKSDQCKNQRRNPLYETEWGILNLVDACKMAGISRKTFYDRKRKGVLISEIFKKGRICKSN